MSIIWWILADHQNSIQTKSTRSFFLFFDGSFFFHMSNGNLNLSLCLEFLWMALHFNTIKQKSSTLRTVHFLKPCHFIFSLLLYARFVITEWTTFYLLPLIFFSLPLPQPRPPSFIVNLLFLAFAPPYSHINDVYMSTQWNWCWCFCSNKLCEMHHFSQRKVNFSRFVPWLSIMFIIDLFIKKKQRHSTIVMNFCRPLATITM